MALVLSFLMLLPSVALAKNTNVVDDAPKTEVIQVDLNAEIEKAMQEDGNLDDGLEIIVGGNEETASPISDFETDKEAPDVAATEPENEISDEDADSPKEISPRGVAYPVTELYILSARGEVNGIENREVLNCGKGKSIDSNASAETILTYDKSTPLTITMQSIGFHLASQKWSTTGDIYLTCNGAPYDYVIGPSGGVKDFKMDYVLTPRDTQAEQTVFDFSYSAYMSDGTHTYPERYHRRLTVNWGDAISDVQPPASVGYNALTTTVSGLNDKMEYSKDKKEWFSMSSGSTQLDVYLLLGYQRGANLYVRYKATDTTLPSAYGTYFIPGLTRPAPDISLTYYADGTLLFENLTPGMRYDISGDAFFNTFSFVAPDSGKGTLPISMLGNSNAVYLRLHSTDTEGPSEAVAYLLSGKNASAVDIISTKADLHNTENLDVIEFTHEGVVEDLGDDIKVIAYDEDDEENANSKTEIISNLEIVSKIAE